MPQINQAGLNLIEEFEGDELRAYADSGGVETIGYGHTGDVTPGETITQAQAVAYLQGDVASASAQVAKLVEIVLTPSTDPDLRDYATEPRNPSLTECAARGQERSG